MSIGARVRVELQEINEAAKRYVDEGFPPYIAYGKARTEWEERNRPKTQAMVEELPPSAFQRVLKKFLNLF